MAAQPQKIVLEPLAGYSALRMIWPRQVDSDDVHHAFQELVCILDQSRVDIQVIVDITNNPKFPIQTVITETLIGSHHHPRLGNWLIVGSNRMGRVIGSVLDSVSKRDVIHWFETEDQAIAYLVSFEDRS